MASNVYPGKKSATGNPKIARGMSEGEKLMTRINRTVRILITNSSSLTFIGKSSLRGSILAYRER